MSDDTTEYEELLPHSRTHRAEWFWLIAGASVGVAASGVAIIWVGMPTWHLVVTGTLGYVCCALFKWRAGVP